MNAAGSHARRIGLGPKQELGTRQDQAQRVLNAGLKIPLILPGLVEAQQRLHVGVGYGPPVSSPRQSLQNLLGARKVVLGVLRRANENPATAGRVSRSRSSKRP